MTEPDTSHRAHEADSPSGRPTRRVMIGGLVFLLALLGLAGAKSYRDLAEVRGREGELRQELAGTEGEIRGLEARIERLRHDPQTLERLAREELGMVRPGDVVIVLPEEETAPGPAGPIAAASQPE